jgi:hypothetical protein
MYDINDWNNARQKNLPITDRGRVCYKMKETTCDYLGVKELTGSINDTKTFDYVIYPYMSNFIPGGEKKLMGSVGSFLYMDYYVRKYGELEYYNPPKADISKKYIIMQYRNVNNMKVLGGNMKKSYFLSMYNDLKDLLGDKYEFLKLGEDLLPEDKDLEPLFDKIIPVDYNLDILFPTIRNSSAVISQHSGINFVALLFGIPTMETCINPAVHPRFSRNHWSHRWGCPKGTLFFETYNSKIWGGWFCSDYPPPSKEHFKDFLTRNGVL